MGTFKWPPDPQVVSLSEKDIEKIADRVCARLLDKDTEYQRLKTIGDNNLADVKAARDEVNKLKDKIRLLVRDM